MDIDGTLLGKDSIISTRDREALKEVGARGLKVSLCTGRAATASLDVINQLSLDGYHIFFDGALVTNPKRNEEVYVYPISKEVVKKAAEFARAKDITLELYSTTSYFAEKETWATDIRRRFFGIETTIVDFSKLWQEERIIKGTLTVSSSEERAKAESFSRQFESSLHFSWAKAPPYPEIDFINVVAPGVSKQTALEALAQHWGIHMNEIVAIGDGTNDISLLSSVGLAVAMGNAPAEVKAVADYVTLDVDHSGLAEAIERFLL